MLQSIFHIRGGLMNKRTILISLMVGFLLCSPASGDTADISNGVLVASNNNLNYLSYYQCSAGHYVYLELPYYGTDVTIHWRSKMDSYGFSYAWDSVGAFDETIINNTNMPTTYDTLGTGTKTTPPANTWFDMVIPDATRYVRLRFVSGGTFMVDDDESSWIPYISYTPLPSYITWTTHPPDSWKVGNYSTLVIGVPEEYKNFTFEYKTPSTNYTTMSIQKNIIPKTFDYTEGKWYYWFSKAVYHSTYGNYSCRITHPEMETEIKTVSVPYFNPDVALPPVVIIPIPDVWVDPPQWNVTIPDKYQNVSWLTNYTVFWGGVGNSTNYTLYATAGLLLTPIEMLNSSISTVHEYTTTAGGMIAGFEHTAIIIKVGWDIIPDDIQNIFIGTAALGIVIFIYHRRT